jgi:erythromycin esterase-like protein
MDELSFENMQNYFQKMKHYDYVLLGESTHGTEEYFKIRLAQTIMLVHDFGFRTILFETEWSLGYQLNLFIHSELEGNIKDILHQISKFPKWMTNNEFIMELLLFLKKWNLENEKDKVYFYGIDCQDIELAEKNVCHDETINCRVVQEIIKNYHEMNKKGNNYWNMRDTFWLHIMDSIKSNKGNKGNKNKFILWAHNSHIGNCKANVEDKNKLNIGYLLQEKYNTLKIGFSTYHGSVMASNRWDKSGYKHILKPAVKGSFEDIFHQISQEVNLKSFMFYCNPAFTDQKLFRYVGVIYDHKNELDAHYQLTNINHEYDLIIYIDKTNHLQLSSDLRMNKMKSIKKNYEQSKDLF